MRSRIAVIFVLLVTGLGLFYWFELRPNTIRKNCEFAIFSKEGVVYKGSNAVRQNNKYRHCLIKNGLVPESLFVNTE